MRKFYSKNEKYISAPPGALDDTQGCHWMRENSIVPISNSMKHGTVSQYTVGEREKLFIQEISCNFFGFFARSELSAREWHERKK